MAWLALSPRVSWGNRNMIKLFEFESLSRIGWNCSNGWSIMWNFSISFGKKYGKCRRHFKIDYKCRPKILQRPLMT
jgi:hypothetical protein